MRIFKRIMSVMVAALIFWQSALFLGIADGDGVLPVLIDSLEDVLVVAEDADPGPVSPDTAEEFEAFANEESSQAPYELTDMDLFREQFYGHHPADTGFGSDRNTLVVDDSGIIHRPFEYVEPPQQTIMARSAPPSPGPFQLNEQRLFSLYIFNDNHKDWVLGNLVAQSNHANVWILDHDHFHQVVEYGHSDANCALHLVDKPLAQEIANTFDGIYDRMTDPVTGFGDHEGVYIDYYTTQPIGDLGRDGKFNIVLYDIYGDGGDSGSYTAGYFTNADQFTTQNHLDMINMDIGLRQGYSTLINNPANFYGTLAHEFQHFLFHAHFGYNMTTATMQRYSWINEALSGLAATYYSQPDTEVIKTAFLHSATSNSYAGSRYGDFVNFNESFKSYGMGHLHSMFLYNATQGTYGRDMYRAFGNVMPDASISQRYAYVSNKPVNELMGDIFSDALYLDVDGADAFAKLYYLFMESFATDGGTVQSPIPKATTKFISNTDIDYNLWAMRNSMPQIDSGGQILLQGYSGIPSATGVTHEMLYRIGRNSAQSKLTIEIPVETSSSLRYYVVLANENAAAGADIFPMENGVQNVVYTEGKDAYLYVVTLYELVNTSVTYSWDTKEPSVIDGDLTLNTQTPVYGQTSSITATLSGCNVLESNILYTWYVGGDEVTGNNSASYPIQEADIGKSVSLHVTDWTGQCTGRLTVSTAPVDKPADPTTPPMPALESKTSTTVALQLHNGYEYSSNAIRWQDSPVFYGLAPNTTYSFYQRVKATSTTSASVVSPALTVTTDRDINDIPATGVVLNTNGTTIPVGNAATLRATVLPANASNPAVTWSSDNTAIATVSSGGVVTAVSAGSANITVTTVDGGFRATCTVGVVTSSTDGGAGGGSSGGSSGGGSSGGGGGGGGGGYHSYGSYYPAAGPSSSSSTSSAATSVAERWVDSATSSYLTVSSDQKTVSSKYTGAFGIRKDALAKYSGMRYYHDTLSGNSVVVRIIVPDLDKVQSDLMVSGSVSGTAVTTREAQFSKWFSNKLKVVHLDQQGSFGQAVEIAVKVDLSEIDRTQLCFYTYQKDTNSYHLLPNTQYTIDANGYLHFHTQMAGDIIISESLLVRK